MKKFAVLVIAFLALLVGMTGVALCDTFKVPEYGLGTEQIGKAASLFNETPTTMSTEEKEPVYNPPYGIAVQGNLSDIPNATFAPSEVAYGQAGDITFNTSVSCNETHCVVTLEARAPQAVVAKWTVTVYNRTTTRYGYDGATQVCEIEKEIAVCPCGITQTVDLPLESELMAQQDLAIWNAIDFQKVHGSTMNRVVQIAKEVGTSITYIIS